jgi:hypothetical protein
MCLKTSIKSHMTWLCCLQASTRGNTSMHHASFSTIKPNHTSNPHCCGVLCVMASDTSHNTIIACNQGIGGSVAMRPRHTVRQPSHKDWQCSLRASGLPP